MLFISLFIIPVLRFVLTCKLICVHLYKAILNLIVRRVQLSWKVGRRGVFQHLLLLKKENNGYRTETFQYDLFYKRPTTPVE